MSTDETHFFPATLPRSVVGFVIGKAMSFIFLHLDAISSRWFGFHPNFFSQAPWGAEIWQTFCDHPIVVICMASIRMACSHLALSYVSARLYTLVRWRKRLRTMRVAFSFLIADCHLSAYLCENRCLPCARHSNQLVEASYRVVSCRRPLTPKLYYSAWRVPRWERPQAINVLYSTFVVQWNFIRSFRNAPDNFSRLRPACKKLPVIVRDQNKAVVTWFENFRFRFLIVPIARFPLPFRGVLFRQFVGCF